MVAVALSLQLLCILFALPTALGVDCFSLLMLNMAACLPVMTPGTTVQNPDEICCEGLKIVLETGAECLCDTLNNTVDLDLGVTFNLTMALTLPSACRFSNISISHCSLSIGTSPAPAHSPSASSEVGGVEDVAPPTAPHSPSSASLTAAFDLLTLPAVTIVSSFALL